MNQIDPRPFGERLRSFRERAALTQVELAERAGLSADAISSLERGVRRRAYPQTLRALADALALSAVDRATLMAAHPPLPTSEGSTTSDPVIRILPAGQLRRP